MSWVVETPAKDGRQRRLRDGYAYRGSRANSAVGGHPGSTHTHRLARDWMLDLWDVDTRRWIYQTETEAYQELGEFWERLDPDARWGGAWGDGGHFSFEHDGVR